MRRTSALGIVNLVGHAFTVSPLGPHRLVRCEVDLCAEIIRFYALRRHDPNHQPLLSQAPYTFPRRPFHE